MKAAVIDAPNYPEEASTLACMELRGGNRNVEETFALPGLDAWLYSSAFGSEQGGDLHYLSTCAHSAVLRFVVADVAGHGAEVSPVATRLKHLLVRNMNKLDQSELAKALNRDFMQDHELGQFITTLLATYYRPTGHLVICNAGHPRPLLYRASSARWEVLDNQTFEAPAEIANLPLGIIEPTDYYQFVVDLAHGDYVVMYSDGFSESRVDGRPLGEEGMCRIAAQCERSGASGLGEELRSRILTASGHSDQGNVQSDDQTMIVLRPIHRDPPDYSIGEKLRSLARVIGILPVR